MQQIDPIRNIIAKNIIRFRKERGMSQDKLAYEADIDRTYIGYIENGKYNITIEKLQTIANALLVKIADLLESDFSSASALASSAETSTRHKRGTLNSTCQSAGSAT